MLWVDLLRRLPKMPNSLLTMGLRSLVVSLPAKVASTLDCPSYLAFKP